MRKLRPLMGLGVPALAVALPWQAHAQLLSRYLPQSVPGYEQDPVQAVLQNGGPDYNALGWRVGDVIVRPEVDESVGYNQNPLGLSNGRSSAEIESAASVNANTDWARDRIGISLNVDDQEFPELPIANQRTDSAFAGGRIDIGRDSLDLSVGHVDSDLGPTNVLTAGLVAPVPYESNDVRAAYNMLFNRLTVTPNIDFTTYRFGSARGDGGEVEDSGLDKNQVVGGATANYAFSEGRSAVFVWDETSADFINRGAGAPNPNYLDTVALAGLDYDTQSFFRYDVLVGYERRDFSGSGIHAISVPVVEASITYLPTLLTTLKAVAIRHLSDASYNVSENLTYTEGVLRVDHALRRNVLLNARVDAAYTDADATNAAHFQLSAGFGATWLLSRRVRLSADYTFSHGSSSGLAGTVSGIGAIGILNLNTNDTYSASAVTISAHFQL
jgi:hypothetical protein